MPWKKENVAIERTNNGKQFTPSNNVTYDLFNSIVKLLMFLKEA